MSRTTVVVGGTAGLGAGIAGARRAAGDRVTVVGRDRSRGEAFAAASGVEFLRGDISTTDGCRAIVDELLTTHDSIDTLVFTAYAPQFRRRLTAEHVELSLALYYVARRIIGEGLAAAMSRSPRPLIVSLNGIGAITGRIHWDDLALERGWSTVEATKQGGRAAELLAVAHAHHRPDAPYLLFHPGYTRTAATGLPRAARAISGLLGALFAQPVSKAIAPILDLLEHPPTAPLTAIDRGREVPLETFADLDDALRLEGALAHAVG